MLAYEYIFYMHSITHFIIKVKQKTAINLLADTWLSAMQNIKTKLFALIKFYKEFRTENRKFIRMLHRVQILQMSFNVTISLM